MLLLKRQIGDANISGSTPALHTGVVHAFGQTWRTSKNIPIQKTSFTTLHRRHQQHCRANGESPTQSRHDMLHHDIVWDVQHLKLRAELPAAPREGQKMPRSWHHPNQSPSPSATMPSRARNKRLSALPAIPPPSTWKRNSYGQRPCLREHAQQLSPHEVRSGMAAAEKPWRKLEVLGSPPETGPTLRCGTEQAASTPVGKERTTSTICAPDASRMRSVCSTSEGLFCPSKTSVVQVCLRLLLTPVHHVHKPRRTSNAVEGLCEVHRDRLPLRLFAAPEMRATLMSPD